VGTNNPGSASITLFHQFFTAVFALFTIPSLFTLALYSCSKSMSFCKGMTEASLDCLRILLAFSPGVICTGVVTSSDDFAEKSTVPMGWFNCVCGRGCCGFDLKAVSNSAFSSGVNFGVAEEPTFCTETVLPFGAVDVEMPTSFFFSPCVVPNCFIKASFIAKISSLLLPASDIFKAFSFSFFNLSGCNIVVFFIIQ